MMDDNYGQAESKEQQYEVDGSAHSIRRNAGLKRQSHQNNVHLRSRRPLASPSVDGQPDAEQTRLPVTTRDHIMEGSASPLSSHQTAEDFQWRNNQRAPYPDAAQTTFLPSTPSDVTSTVSQGLGSTSYDSRRQSSPSYVPIDRSLPHRNVTNENLDDAYVAFILYCNPNVPVDAGSHELRKGFRAPPKSDGKSFSTFTLLELIRRFENKEIRTWTQLAILLGVEPPMAGKNQSAQKVQQYAVRLKRWMHAMHVDAFFEYCLGKPHNYYTQIPAPQAPYPEAGRDGVPFEEDLVLRALHPESRPKRGRRKAEERGDDHTEKGTSATKRQHLDTSRASGDPEHIESTNANLLANGDVPLNCHPEGLEHYVHDVDPWAAASTVTPDSMSTGYLQTPHPGSAASTGQHFRWRLSTRDNGTPSTPHPLSSITPATAHPPDSAFEDVPSAVTPSSSTSKTRARRRHGPAVSSAWPSGANTNSGKHRGRPPTNRSVRDGPFSTFPANPKSTEVPISDVPSPSLSAAHSRDRELESGQNSHLEIPECHSASSTPPPQRPSFAHYPVLQGKPSGLHLEVPQRVGGAVHLATPSVLVNGEGDHIPALPFARREHGPEVGIFDGSSSVAVEGEDQLYFQGHHRSLNGFNIRDLVREFAALLMKTEITGVDITLDSRRAERLATKLIIEMRQYEAHNSLDEFENEMQFAYGCATLLGLGPVSQNSIQDIQIECHRRPATPQATNSRSRVDEQLDEQLKRAPESQAEDVRTTKPGTTDDEVVYHVSYTLSKGPLRSEVSLKASLSSENTSPRLVISDTGNSRDHGHEAAEISEDAGADGRSAWKERYLALSDEVRSQRVEMANFKKRVLNAVF